MGRKSGSKKKKMWIKKHPDEVLQFGPVRVARYGNLIEYSNVALPEYRKEISDGLREQNQNILTDLPKKITEIQEIIKSHSALELMQRAVHKLLPLVVNLNKEGASSPENELVLPAMEYLQYLITRTEACAKPNQLTDKAFEEIWERLIEVIQMVQLHLIIRERKHDVADEIQDLRFIIDTMRLVYRVDRYQVLLKDYWETSLRPYEEWLVKAYGQGAEQIIDTLVRFDEYRKTAIFDKYAEALEGVHALIERLQEQGYAVDNTSDRSEQSRVKHALASEKYRSDHQAVTEKVNKAFTPEAFNVGSMLSSLGPLLPALSVHPGESPHSDLIGKSKDDLSPLSLSSLHHKPFLEINGEFYYFYHSGFEDRIVDIIEEDLATKYPSKQSVMFKRRSEAIENVARDIFVAILEPEIVHQNVYYPNPNKPGDLTELDVLVSVDDLLFLIEVKAGGLSSGASRGAPKDIASELTDIVIKGQQQSERAEKYIRSQPEVKFFDSTGKRPLLTIQHADYRRIFRIIVTREQLGWVGARLAVLSILDTNMKNQYPWHVSLDDLRVVQDLFKGKQLQFVHYLEQRLEATSSNELVQHDELDHVALYMKKNQYTNLPVKDAKHLTFGPDVMAEIDSFYMERAAGGNPIPPSQDLPGNIYDLITALNESRLPGRFEAASVILILGEDGRRLLNDSLGTLDEALVNGSHKTCRLPLAEVPIGISVTYANDEYYDTELKCSAQQIIQSNSARWVVVQLAEASKKKVTKISILSPDLFSNEDLVDARIHLEELAQQSIRDDLPGRNDSCPCGSGKKFKKCHGR